MADRESRVVSVVIPAWNVLPWLPDCLASVAAQTIGLDRLEVIAVDDGSTDGTETLLDAYAAEHPWVTLLRQPNSGGAGSPRNVGIEHAAGRYVFFLDGDDYLGPEALERLVAMAERNGSDVVLGAMVGVGGRHIARRARLFTRDRDRVEPEVAMRSGNALSLFRRSFVERLGLRFVEGVAIDEDTGFTTLAYLEAGTISVVGAYPCYYARSRPGSLTQIDRHDDLVRFFERVERERIEVIAAHRRPGEDRDRLLVRPLQRIAGRFWGDWRARDAAERRSAFETAAAIARRWASPGLEAELSQHHRIVWDALVHHRLAELEAITARPLEEAYAAPIVEGDRIFARLPHFRDGSGFPDEAFEITRQVKVEAVLERAQLDDGRLELAGHAFLRLLGGRSVVELRRVPDGPRRRFPAEPIATPDLRAGPVIHSTAGFRVVIPLAAGGRDGIGPGTWEAWIECQATGIRRRARLLAPDGIPDLTPDAGAALAAALARGPDGGLEVRVAGRGPGAGGGLVGRGRRLAGRARRRLGRVLGRVLGPVLGRVPGRDRAPRRGRRGAVGPGNGAGGGRGTRSRA